MEAVRIEHLEVDRCVRCGGLWFDRTDHEAIRQMDGAEAIDSGPVWQAPMHDVQGKSFCPRDGAQMRRGATATEPRVWIERCPVCDGSFFDAGEFTELKEHELLALVRRSRPGRPAD